MMKKIDGKWICSSCSPTKAETKSATRKAVVVTCPVCNKQQLYCGVDGELSPIKWKQGVDYHLDHHNLEGELKERYRQNALNEKQTMQVPQSLCDESDNRGWDNYGL
ncbi:hypothetical protein [Halorussus halobius]|uniref:hypothetical protein n=1 Tax=Halorussus halobius TaxID=1710537 RepID=UPI001092B8B2|nr:hypothetical protein [Halorussus halobius]